MTSFSLSSNCNQQLRYHLGKHQPQAWFSAGLHIPTPPPRRIVTYSASIEKTKVHLQGADLVRELLHDFDSVSPPYHSAQEDHTLSTGSNPPPSPLPGLSSLSGSYPPNPHDATAGQAPPPPRNPPAAHGNPLSHLDPSAESFRALQRRQLAHPAPQVQ